MDISTNNQSASGRRENQESRRAKAALACHGLFVLFILLCTACDNAPSPEAAVRRQPAPKTLAIAVPSDPGVLDPAGNDFSETVSTLVYDTLVTIAPDGAVVPNIAESWTRNADATVWTFTLKPGLAFHDGAPCDAAAAAFSLQRACRAYENSAIDPGIRSIAVVDAHTLQVTLQAPFAPLLRYLSLPFLGTVISPACVDPPGDTAGTWQRAIGTGPFQLISRIKRKEMVFQRNNRYRKKKPAMETIVLKVIPDPESRLMALEANEVDLLYFNWEYHGSVNLISGSRFKDSEQIRIVTGPGAITKILQMNTARAPFRELKWRRRLAGAVNRSEIAELVGIQAVAADCGMFPCWMNEAIALESKSYPFQERSSENRKRSATIGKLRLIVNALFPVDRLLAEYLQDRLLVYGFDLEILQIENALYWEAIHSGSYDLAFNVTFGINYDPFGTFRHGLENAGGKKANYLLDPDLEQMVCRLFKTADERKQRRLIRRIHSACHEKVACIPLYYENQLAVMSARLHGFSFGAYGLNIPWHEIDLANESDDRRQWTSSGK